VQSIFLVNTGYYVIVKILFLLNRLYFVSKIVIRLHNDSISHILNTDNDSIIVNLYY